MNILNEIAEKTRERIEKDKKGNSVFKGIRLMAYRAIAPTAPPSATNKNGCGYNGRNKKCCDTALEVSMESSKL